MYNNMRIPAFLVIFAFVLTFMACKSEKERAIIGKWQADSLVECDEIVPIVSSLVNIEFTSNGNYAFNSTLNIHEEGTYKIKKNYLILQNSLIDKALEKTVLITKLTADTLVLEMNFKGKEQWLTFAKDSTLSKNENNSAPKAPLDTEKAVAGKPVLSSSPKSND